MGSRRAGSTGNEMDRGRLDQTGDRHPGSELELITGQAGDESGERESAIHDHPHERSLRHQSLDMPVQMVAGTRPRRSPPLEEDLLGPDAHHHLGGVVGLPEIRRHEAHRSHLDLKEALRRGHDPAGDDGFDADDLGHRDVAGTPEHLVHLAVPEDQAVVDDQHPVAQNESLRPVMRDDQDGDLELGQKGPELAPQMRARGCVEGGQRLIEKKKLATFRHTGFWAAMDTFKDKITYDRMHGQGKTPWEVWRKA